MNALPEPEEKLSPALQRARGAGRLRFGAGGLETLYQQGCIKLRLPRVAPGALAEAVVINSSGGVTGGDRLSLEVSLGACGALSLASQAAERIYRSAGGVARITNRLTLGAGARLDWLPQETILYDSAALARRLEVDMAADARLLAVETLVFGRAAMGERVGALHLRDAWRIRRAGRLIWADSLRLDLPDPVQHRSAGMGGLNALATMILVAPEAESRLGAVRARIGRMAGVDVGASAWNGLLLVRLAASDAQDLRKGLVELIAPLRGLALPRVWML